jgi:Flp pilus assembly protein CpaB
MKKNNLLKLLGIALVVAIVSTGIFYGLVAGKLSSSTGSGKMLVVAAKPLKPGTVLQTTDVKLMPWPGDQLPKGGFGNVTDVTGNTVFDPIDVDEPVFAARLASSQGAAGSGVPTGMRAVSVHVTDSTGVITLLRSGQKVDVQVVVGRSGGEKVETSVRTALEGLKVLSVTPQIEQGSQGQNLPVVTLLAKPNEADILAAADSGARVRLTLRNPLDEETRGSGALTLTTVMHSSNKSASKSTDSTKSVDVPKADAPKKAATSGQADKN